MGSSSVPLFDWGRSHEEARGAWQGFLWTPRFFVPLVGKLKAYFLATAHHLEDLGDFGQGYASMLALSGLEPRGLFTVAELRRVVHRLPSDGLAKVAHAVADFQIGAGETGSEYWMNRTSPFFRDVWPKSADRKSPQVSHALARICVAAGSSFQHAFDQLSDWLVRDDNAGLAVVELAKSRHCVNYPETALAFLLAIVGDHWPPTSLADCLNQIRSAKPALATTPEYDRLERLLKAWGRT